MMLTGTLENKGGNLFFDDVSTLELSAKIGTPLYVISEKRIRENYRRLFTALAGKYEKVKIFYAAKANTNLTILKILKSEGSHIDTVSLGEVFLALSAGFSPEKILFTGTSVRSDELKYLVDKGVMINIDSLSQLKRLIELNVPEIVSVRINPEFGAGHHEHCITAGPSSKFGLWEEDALEAYRVAAKAGVKRFGIHMHIGSGIMSVEPFMMAASKLLEVAGKVHQDIDVDFEFIDIGGGIGVPYGPDEDEFGLDSFAENILGLFKSKIETYRLGKPFFYIEPGRYIVSDASILLTVVNTVKVTPYKKFAGVDAGFNTLVRPAMYGSYHHALVANNLNASPEETYDIVGPICESGDILAKDRKLPKLKEGDLLAFLNAGAYGFAMSSQYNSRLRAAEVLVKNGEYNLVREREDFEDLKKGQNIPKWLK